MRTSAFTKAIASTGELIAAIDAVLALRDGSLPRTTEPRCRQVRPLPPASAAQRDRLGFHVSKMFNPTRRA